MTIDERNRTCSYHWITFKTWAKFMAHWDTCSVRVEAEYINEDLGGHS